MYDNLLDPSHLGYVHLRTIGGNARTHMNAQMQVTGDDSIVRNVRHMPDSEALPTYTAAYPFKDRIDRWQEIEIHLSHLFYHLICDGLANAGHMVKNRLPFDLPPESLKKDKYCDMPLKKINLLKTVDEVFHYSMRLI
mgnify:CR=1 FL=1